MSESKYEKVRGLSCWKNEIAIEPLSGGMTNFNFRVTDGDEDYVVRLGNDTPHHLILRSNEAAASRSAYAIGVSPELIHVEPGALVIRYIEGKVFDEKDIRDQKILQRIVQLLKKFHLQMPQHFSGYTVMFWVFQVLRHYRNILSQGNSHYQSILPKLMDTASNLESIVGPVNIVFGHNDLLAANFIDDGQKLWLIDFDYAGFNSPLFDLSNLASNSELPVEQEKWLLENYFESTISNNQWRSYNAMKCASLLREAMWSMVSELYSDIDFDYVSYTEQNMNRFERVLESFQLEFGTV